MLFDPVEHPALGTFDIPGRLEMLEGLQISQSLDPITRVGKQTRICDDPGSDPPAFPDDETLVFASNNFLGLATDERVQAAAKDAIERVGTGAGASRVAVGDTAIHRRLEREIAATKHTDRALVYSSGYATNIGVITAMYPSVIFSDEYNHTSIIEASRMTDADIVSYTHCDAEDLAAKMAARAGSGPTEKWLIVTDSVFSMDGDVAPLEAICCLADEYGAWVMVDEAHATGVFGAEGGGIVQREGLEDRVDIQMGTLSKALASQGGYVAGESDLVEYLATASRSFLFSTGLNPPAAGAARKALEIARESARAQKLHENAARLRSGLAEMGFEVWGSTQIVPVLVGDEKQTREFGRRMRERDILVHAVPYPAVPPGTSRIRLIPMATHTRTEIDRVLDACEQVGRELGLL